MPGPWQRRLARVDATEDRHWGEAVLVSPMMRGQFGVIADPDRPAFTVTALLVTGRAETDLGGEGSKLWNVILPAGKAELQVRHVVLPDGFVFQLGDKVTAMDRPGLPTFEVARVDRHYLGRLHIRMNTVG